MVVKSRRLRKGWYLFETKIVPVLELNAVVYRLLLKILLVMEGELQQNLSHIQLKLIGKDKNRSWNYDIL